MRKTCIIKGNNIVNSVLLGGMVNYLAILLRYIII